MRRRRAETRLDQPHSPRRMVKLRSSGASPLEVRSPRLQKAIDDPGHMFGYLQGLPFVRDWKVLNDALFMLTSFPIGLAFFIIGVTGFATGLALSWLGVGLVIIAWTFAFMLWGAQLERSRLRIFLNANVGSPYRWDSVEGGFVRRSWELIRTPQVWRDVLYMFLLFPIGIMELIVVLLPVDLIISPIVVAAGGSIQPDVLMGWKIDTMPESLLALVLGLVLLLPVSALINVGARMHGELGLLLLGTSNEELMTRRVEELTESRSAVMRAMHMERRRIERDLHDGAQQQLVSLAMDLGRAREKMDSDPDGARKIIEESHEKSKLVLTEMRDLVRGIHPAVLSDRGLDAAISAIAGRSPIPVTVDVRYRERMPEEVEGTAYFVVVEALTNIAKHANATQALVRIERDGDWLRIIVTDNGQGGADPDRGTGMRGLRDRIQALEGTFAFTSPPGKGTRITVEIPCG